RVRSVPALQGAERGEDRRADLPPLLQRAHGRPHPGAGRGADRSGGNPRGAAGAGRTLRRAVRAAGGGVSLKNEGDGGGGGIRTHGPRERPAVFKTAALDRSATPPGDLQQLTSWP